MVEGYKYRAFISYSHLDRTWGDWLHRALETYRIPRRLAGTAGRDGPVPKTLFPIFRDREELPTASDLSSQITEALEQSACLVVICSPRSAVSRWVNEEILHFKRLGRENRIVAVIVDGEPNASDKAGIDSAFECFPPGLRFHLGPKGGLSARRTEPIAADARAEGDGKHNAKLKLIAGLLGVKYDALKRRDETRRMVRNMVAASVFAAFFGALSYYGWQNYDRGTLVADSDPVNSSILVDGIELGARIRNLPLRSGQHRLVAWAPGHFERSRTIDVQRGKTVKARFWLEKGYEAEPYTRIAIQSGLVLIEDVNDTLIVNNELDRLVFLSASTSKPVFTIATPEGNTRTFLDLDLGGDTGRVIVSAYDAEKTGPDVLVVQARSPPVELWRWQGPATTLDRSSSLAVVAVPSGDGSADLAVAGRNGKIYVLDGATGAITSELAISDDLLKSPPMLIPYQDKGAMKLAVSMRPNLSGDQKSPLQIMSLTLPKGKTNWRRSFEPGWNVSNVALVANTVSYVVLWSDTQWQLIDLSTGLTRNRGALPGRIAGGPTFANLDRSGGPDLIFIFEDPEVSMRAVRPFDGSTRWEGPSNLSVRGQPAGPNNQLLTTPKGELLVHLANALAAIDPKEGRIVWKVNGKPRGTIVGDWDGDGKNEIFVAMGGIGMLSLDSDGRVLWKLRTEESNIRPRALVKSKIGGFTRSLVVHLHAALIGVVHGPRMLWRNSAPGQFQATPLVIMMPGGSALVAEIVAKGDAGAALEAFEGKNGGRRWTAEGSFYPNRGATLADLDGDGTPEIIAFGRYRPTSPTADLLAYRPDDGRLVRKLSVSITGWFSSTPAVADFRGSGKNDVAISTWDERSIMLVDGATGKIVWKHRTGAANMDGVSSGDLDGDGVMDVVAASFDGFVYGLKGMDGSLLWKAPIEGGGWSRPVVAPLGADREDHVLTISLTGRLYVFNARTGKRVWSPDIIGKMRVAGRPVVIEKDGRTVILAPLGAAGIVAFDWATRTEIWRSPVRYAANASPVVTDFGLGGRDYVVFASANGKVFVLNLDDGRPFWNDNIASGAIEADPVVADLDGDGIYDILIASHDFKMSAVSGSGIFGKRRE